MDYRKAIDEAMLYCTMLPEFRCGIFVRTEAEYDAVCEFIDKKTLYCIKTLGHKRFCAWIFKNASILSIVYLPNEGYHASRINMAYLSESIAQDVISTIISPMIIPYQFRGVMKVIGADNK